MSEFFDKYRLHNILIQPIKFIGFPRVKDKIDALHKFKGYADTSDIEYIYILLSLRKTMSLHQLQLV